MVLLLSAWRLTVLRVSVGDQARAVLYGGLRGAAAGGGGLHQKKSGAEQEPVQAEGGEQRQDCCGQDDCETE
jgi:hypothetical protein